MYISFLGISDALYLEIFHQPPTKTVLRQAPGLKWVKRFLEELMDSIDIIQFYENCRLCPRYCGVSRVTGGGTPRLGFCGETDQLRVAYIGPHFGEEPPITGKNGSGTVFLTGCPLRCSFCQNYQISHQGVGISMSLKELFRKLKIMILKNRVHNINFVTPDHFFPHVFKIVSRLRKNTLDLPIIYNLSGYESVEILKTAEEYVDIYLPDFKYSDPSLAAELSKCPDYPEVALEALAEMIGQKGPLDVSFSGGSVAGKGVLVRHLILPGKVKNSMDILTTLFVEFGSGLPLSLMSQYVPVVPNRDKDLNRFVSKEEFDAVYDHARDLGFEHLFVQFPEKDPSSKQGVSPYLPDFTKTQPFE
jgi:putative pyruvate formate lyase activating enzyme